MELANSRFRQSVSYRFGPFELRTAVAQLRRRGIRVPLVGQPLQILQILLENPERIVSRDELREALWPDNVHIDFDGALNSAVKKLRQALEDSGSEERYIETVPRLGYRFVGVIEAVAPPTAAPLHLVPPPLAAEPTPEPIVEIAARGRSLARGQIWFWPAIGSLVLIGAVGVALFWRMSGSESSVRLANRSYLTSFPGEQTLPAISPDGGQVAFSWADPERDRVPSIYVTSINGLGLHRLTEAGVRDFAPAWSPDGSQIAFIRDSGGGNGTIIAIPSSGGPERRIAETEASFAPWVPGGGAVLTAEHKPGERNSSLWSVSLATGERRAVTGAGEYMDRWDRFAYSPDGSQLGYVAWRDSKGPPDLWVRRTSGGAPRRVTSLGNRLHNWCWLPDGRSVLVVSDEQGTWRLFRIRLDVRGAAPEPIEGAGDDVLWPASFGTAAGARLVFCQQRFTSNLHRFSIRRDARGLPLGLDDLHSVAPSTRRTMNPQIDRRGRRLTFVSNRSLFTEIWVSDADGGSAHPLTSFSSADLVPGSPKWSPDGTKVVFTALTDGITSLYLAAADGRPPVRLSQRSFDAIRPSFSHDGDWIYFSRRDAAAAHLRLWKIPARADVTERDAQPLLGAGVEVRGLEPIESPEGGTVYYMPLQSSTELWSVSTAGGAPRRVIGSGIRFGWWTPAPGGIYYVDLTKAVLPVEPAHAAILYFDLASGTSRVIGELPGPVSTVLYHPGIAVAGDFLWTDWADVATTNLIRGDLGGKGAS